MIRRRKTHPLPGSDVSSQSGSRPVTSHEVAKLAGVSRAAVSRAFTPHASIAEATRKRVMEAAVRLGYRPNVLARSLITRKSNMIGMIMADWENPSYTAVLRGFNERLQQRGYEVMLLTSRQQLSIDSAIRRLLQYQVAGIVLVSALPSAQATEECARAGVHVVVVNRDTDDLRATSVVCDHDRLGRRMAEAVVKAGYSRCALLRGDPGVASGIVRTAAFKAALARLGTGCVVADRVNAMGYDAGRAAIRELMSLATPPDVILCSSDLTAIGVVDGARIDLGVAIPRNLGVIGFGDSPAASWAAYDLATVRLPIDAMIESAVAAVLDPPRSTAGIATAEAGGVFEAELVLRSTLRARRARRAG
jgi:DNA-binding LacI/PurR family transcriptional regulator